MLFWNPFHPLPTLRIPPLYNNNEFLIQNLLKFLPHPPSPLNPHSSFSENFFKSQQLDSAHYCCPNEFNYSCVLLKANINNLISCIISWISKDAWITSRTWECDRENVNWKNVYFWVGWGMCVVCYLPDLGYAPKFTPFVCLFVKTYFGA